MATLSSDVSSDDDCYINAAACLKALKKKLNDAAPPVSDSDSMLLNSPTTEGFSSFVDVDLSYEGEKQKAPTARSTRQRKNKKSPVPDPEPFFAEQQHSNPPTNSRRRTRNRKSPARVTNLPVRQQNGSTTRSTRRTRTQKSQVADEIIDVQLVNAPTTRARRRACNRKSADNNKVAVTHTISLTDSDSDELIIQDSKDDAEDDADQNYEVSVKVFWRSCKMMRFPLRKFQAFTDVFEHLANLEAVPQSRILLMHGEKRQVHPNDTPDSLGLTIIDILDGGLVDMEVERKRELDEDSVNINIQMKDRKEKLSFFMKRNQKFRALVSMCSERLSISEDRIKLCFDGELVNLSDTPESLDLEGGECFDMHASP